MNLRSALQAPKFTTKAEFIWSDYTQIKELRDTRVAFLDDSDSCIFS